MQRLGFSQVHSECDKFPATLSSQWHTHKCQQACFILHPYVAMGTAHGSEGRGQAEGWGGSSLQSPQAEPETPRTEKDMGVLRAWDIDRTRSPLESSACACGCLSHRYCRGRMKPYLQSSSSPVHCSLNCCFCMSSLPSEYKIFLYEISRSLQLTVTPIVFADFFVPTTCLYLRAENKDFSVSHTCKGVLGAPVYGH